MARKPKAPAAPAVPFTEQIPSVQGGLSALATANAPLIFFDEVPNSGAYNGIVHLTLEALRFTVVNGVAVNDRVVTAHLRCNFNALVALKGAIANAERQIAAQASGAQIKH